MVTDGDVNDLLPDCTVSAKVFSTFSLAKSRFRASAVSVTVNVVHVFLAEASSIARIGGLVRSMFAGILSGAVWAGHKSLGKCSRSLSDLLDPNRKYSKWYVCLKSFHYPSSLLESLFSITKPWTDQRSFG